MVGRVAGVFHKSASRVERRNRETDARETAGENPGDESRAPIRHPQPIGGRSGQNLNHDECSARNPEPRPRARLPPATVTQLHNRSRLSRLVSAMAARSAMGFAAGALRQTVAAQARVAPSVVPRTIGQQTRSMGGASHSPSTAPRSLHRADPAFGPRHPARAPRWTHPIIARLFLFHAREGRRTRATSTRPVLRSRRAGRHPILGLGGPVRPSPARVFSPPLLPRPSRAASSRSIHPT